MIDCAVCATPVPDDSKFCHNCGSLVSDAEGQARASRAMDVSATVLMENLLKEATAGVYEIEKMLGKGGMACVYLASETQLGRQVAIKVLPPELTFGHGVERFMREAKTAARLEHPNIIPIYRVATEGKIFWYAMKYLDGRSLDELLKEKTRFSLPEAIEILERVASALDYAHERGVIHRDIKPANVMLDGFGSVIVTDFGIAKAVSGTTLTASGAVVGTPYYMSPEQASGTSITGHADQYSLAVMAYQMVSGRWPFEGDSAFDIMFKHCKEPVPPLDIIAPTIPAFACRAIEKALAKKAEDRFPSVRAFVDALRAPAGDQGETVAPRRVSAWRHAETRVAPAVQRRRPSLGIAAVTVVMAGGAIGGWLLWRGRSPASQPTSPGGNDRAPVASVPVAAPPVNTQPARLEVTGLPPGGSFLLDGVGQDSTTIATRPGSHVLQLSASGFTTTFDTVTVNPEQTLSIRYGGAPLPRQTAARPAPSRPPETEKPKTLPPSTMGVVMIRTIGNWATISIDGVRKAENNRYVDTLPVGTHVFLFEREGYVAFDTTLMIRGGDTLRLQIQMRPRS